MTAFEFGSALGKSAAGPISSLGGSFSPAAAAGLAGGAQAGSAIASFNQRKQMANAAMGKLTQPPQAPAGASSLPSPAAWANQIGGGPAASAPAAAPAAPAADPRPGTPGNRPSFNAQQRSALDAARARQRAMLAGGK